MIKLVAELAHNIYTFAGLALGSIGGIIVAIINSRSKENKEVKRLKGELEVAHSHAEGLRKAFNIAYDQLEREGLDVSILKDVKKEYDL